MKRIDTTKKLFAPQDAERIASEMKRSDPDWAYTAIHDPKGTGFSYVEIRDESGAVVGWI